MNYMNADAIWGFCWLCKSCCIIAFMAYYVGTSVRCWLQPHSVDWSDYVVLPCGGLMAQCPSHDWIWYHMHVSDEVAFYSKRHCMCMSWWLIGRCVLLRILWWCCCCPINILSFISFIMNCEYSPCLLLCCPYLGNVQIIQNSFLVRGI